MPAAADGYKNRNPERTDPIRKAFAIAAGDDANDLAVATRGLYLGVAGTIKVTFADDADANPVVVPNLAAGVWHPMSVKRVWATGTGAGVFAGGVLGGI
jgi:hypothetical protein